MIAHELRTLVYDANSSLVNNGRFPDGWLELYQTTLAKVSYAFDGALWPKDVFAALHYVSTHLCLRYNAWKAFETNRNTETECTLGRVHLETDVFLWTAVTRVPRWDAEPLLRADEVEFISLCFGDLSPVQLVTEESSFVAWKKSYQEFLGKLQEPVRRADHWAKWLCTAFHFAAFYVDLYQQQDIALDHERACATANNEIPSLTSRLSDCIESHRVLRLIEVWLESASIGRNSAGIPQLAEPRPRTGQFISVRTPTELLIQSSVETVRV